MKRDQEKELYRYEEKLIGMKKSQLMKEQDQMAFNIERTNRLLESYRKRMIDIRKDSDLTITQLKETNAEYKFFAQKHSLANRELAYFQAAMQKVLSAMERINKRVNKLGYTMQEQIDEAMLAAEVFVSDLKFRTEHATKQVRTAKMFRAYEMLPDGELNIRRGKPGIATVWESYDQDNPTLMVDVERNRETVMQHNWRQYQIARQMRSENILNRRREVVHA